MQRIEEFAAIMHQLSLVNLSQSPDKGFWRLEPNGLFLVSTLLYDFPHSPNGTAQKIYDLIWEDRYPKKVFSLGS